MENLYAVTNQGSDGGAFRSDLHDMGRLPTEQIQGSNHKGENFLTLGNIFLKNLLSYGLMPGFWCGFLYDDCMLMKT